ncbi:catechol 2,3-dioxygenase [Nocardioides sp. GY 10127]|uniref:catechol 2,3-dioxygenase n=1 Tax=Nocardioides sp. GY 10127 TaxID=2569762 RepID=UPI0010A87231|nr:catechol 2,3-dioxygenase [Nocardioides sp. GY 10127]TIC81765.1 catechol 2,3-dioxygenase [Nocardioides sp. GY 10127]
MGIMRMGYVHTRVTDLAAARQHYEETLGLYPVLEEPGKVYYKGWDEWDHHSVVLEEGGVGAAKFGWKVQRDEDIEEIEKKAWEFGCSVERMSRGENPEIGDGIRIIAPSTHVMEVYSQATAVGMEVGTHNPERFPRHLRGVGVPGLDHALIATQDPGLLERFFHHVFDMYTTERFASSFDDDAKTIASWMTTGNQYHSIACIEGPEGKLHHFAFKLEDWNAIGHAADLFTMDDVPIDMGPTKHGITRGSTVYFFDPAGNRNEVFAGGAMAYPDRPLITWTPDHIARGIYYHAREINDRFTTVYT